MIKKLLILLTVVSVLGLALAPAAFAKKRSPNARATGGEKF